MRKDKVAKAAGVPNLSKHETVKFICPIENLEFSTFAELQAHFMPRHGQDAQVIPSIKFICPYDEMNFNTLNDLYIHVAEKHPQGMGVIEPAFEAEETFIKDVGINNPIEPSVVDVKNGRIVRIRPLHLTETGYSKRNWPPVRGNLR